MIQKTIKKLKTIFHKIRSRNMNKKNNIINPNIHIQEYLENYLKLSNPEYAILLNGKWGSGKTYFIDTFISEHKEANIKFIKISLFGLKDTNSIDEEIFQNLHPLLGSKYTKITGNILKSALKLGVNLDWNQDDKKDGTANVDLKEFNPLDFFSDKKKSKQEIIFIFDDLERTEINLKEVLGYINYLVEQSNFKVIILANEEKIDYGDYKEFKEKIIGKTFEVKHSFEHILTSFIDSKTNLSKEILYTNAQIIKENYEIAKYNNLRHISQILFDFEYFVENIDKEYLKCEDFVSILINHFFAISIELKSANLTREELSKRKTIVWDFSDNKKKEKTNIEKIYEKYNITNNPLFAGENWVKILLDNSIQKEALNELISNLSFFLEKKEKAQASWVKIWNYGELSNEEFNKNLSDVLNKFQNCEYDIPEHFIHVIALLIFFSKNQLCKITIEDIKSQVETCIEEKYQKHENWKNELFKDRIRFNRTGLGYMGQDDKDFREIFSLIIEKNKSIYEVEENDKQQQLLNKFLESIKQFDEKFLIDFFMKFETTPIFNLLEHKSFTNILTSIENKNISMLGDILHSRYSHDRLNGREYYSYLTNELDFWKSVHSNLDIHLQNTQNKTLNTFLLNQFNIYLVKDVIDKMENA